MLTVSKKLSTMVKFTRTNKSNCENMLKTAEMLNNLISDCEKVLEAEKNFVNKYNENGDIVNSDAFEKAMDDVDEMLAKTGKLYQVLYELLNVDEKALLETEENKIDLF